jgi:site-specific DNA-methyltransferase (adenine-specific)
MVEIVHGDCREVLRDWLGRFDFGFFDPPFCIGQNYAGYVDKMSEPDYQEFTTQWILAAWMSLRPGAAMVIHGSIKLRPVFWRSIIELELDEHYETEVAWHYRFGVCHRGNWIDGHCPEIVLRQPGERKWYPEAVLVESDRAAVYGDPRVFDHDRGGRRVPGTVWGVPSDGPFFGRVQGTNRERRKAHPNQLPERLLERHILAYTLPGDCVVDGFGGSGTTAVVADALGRSCVTIDCSEESCESARRRVEKGAVRIVAETSGSNLCE